MNKWEKAATSLSQTSDLPVFWLSMGTIEYLLFELMAISKGISVN